MNLRHFRCGMNLWLTLAVSLWIPRVITQEATPTRETIDLAPQSATAITEIERVEHNILHRPIELAEDKTHWIDRSYAYGDTRLNARPVHLGVEFVNERNTAVYAAKAGRVVFAGEDTDAQLGPILDYYGKVVVLSHDISSLDGQRLFTLYGHLERIDVKTGQMVGDQARVGRVGSSGVALGAHLHFEVRVGDPFDYLQTRNPELWLQHYLDHGMIVGSLRDQDGEMMAGWRLAVRTDADSRDVFTYGGDEVNSDPVWRENFTAGDLREGEYEIVVLDENGALAHQEHVEVEAYRTTVVEIVLEN
ncbi:MAG: M23 family metallopeptidase [Chloroflexota bacterium]|nr:M23 family metallopeptidase [Chloroflexota bacterium]MDE2908950.1 M23 family metallopeptidase [Chloroflexota bacterium]